MPWIGVACKLVAAYRGLIVNGLDAQGLQTLRWCIYPLSPPTPMFFSPSLPPTPSKQTPPPLPPSCLARYPLKPMGLVGKHLAR